MSLKERILMVLRVRQASRFDLYRVMRAKSYKDIKRVDIAWWALVREGAVDVSRT